MDIERYKWYMKEIQRLKELDKLKTDIARATYSIK